MNLNDFVLLNAARLTSDSRYRKTVLLYIIITLSYYIISCYYNYLDIKIIIQFPLSMVIKRLYNAWVSATPSNVSTNLAEGI